MNDPTMPQAHMRSAWNISAMLRRGKLTDRKIAQYEKAGYYTPEFRQARRDLQARKRKRRREGSFDVTDDGRMIYNPK